MNEEVEDCSDHKGNEGCDPVHGEHGEEAEEHTKQRNPRVVEFETWTPPRRLGDAGMEDTEVYKGIDSDKEVRKERRYYV